MMRVSHFEVPADEPERLVKFYEEAFGWTVEKWDGPMDYWLVMTGPEDQEGIDGGISRRGKSDSGTINSVDVPDIDAAIEKITGAGGTITVPKLPVPGVGWLAYFKDTEGNTFCVMEEDTSVK